jgi:phytoene dehydrogenase-like protein
VSRYDAIVIGAGHNGLTTAALLAKQGREVLVVERSDVVGGLAAAEEFHPGYHSGGLLHDTTGVRDAVVRELELEKHGLRMRSHRPDVLALGDDGQSLLVRGDRVKAVEEIDPVSKKDAWRYADYHAFVDRVRPVLRQFLNQPPLDLVNLETIAIRDGLNRGLKLRSLGRRDMMELLRLPPMCVGDWLDEWFETDLLKTAMAFPAVAGTFMGPRSPSSNFNLLLWEAAAGPGVAGGGPALIAALEGSARAQGVEFRTGASVERIVVDSGAVKGVVVAGDEQIEAVAVAASCDPRHAMLDLLAPGVLPYRAAERLRGFRQRGTTAQVLLALESIPRFAARPDEAIELARTGANLLAIERAFDAVKYRTIADEPVLEIAVPSAATPDLAPAGHAVVSVLVHFTPYDLEPEWNDAERERLGDRVMGILDRHIPGVSSSVLAGVVLGPPDIERRYGVTGGHIHHGEHALDQLLIRPTPECLRYATPIEGLYLCGSGSHPGGGLTCAPGRGSSLEMQHFYSS